MRQLFYRIIYHSTVNFVLRNLNKRLHPFLPNSLKLPPSGKIKVKVDTFAFYFLANQTSHVAKLIFWDGPSQFEYTDIFIGLVKKTGRFLDIGANIGYYSILAAKSNPDIEVTSFEPASGPLHYLKKNVVANKIGKNIKVESCAIGDREGFIEFNQVFNKKYRYLKHNLAGEGNAGSKVDAARFKPTQVDSIRLDHYLDVNGSGPIDLIKLDTEGTEADILSNAKKTLSIDQPIVICETLFNAIEDKLENLMSSHNYLFFNHVESGLKQVDSIKRNEDDGVRNCFFVPPSKVNLIQEFIVLD